MVTQLDVGSADGSLEFDSGHRGAEDLVTDLSGNKTVVDPHRIEAVEQVPPSVTSHESDDVEDCVGWRRHRVDETVEGNTSRLIDVVALKVDQSVTSADGASSGHNTSENHQVDKMVQTVNTGASVHHVVDHFTGDLDLANKWNGSADDVFDLASHVKVTTVE